MREIPVTIRGSFLYEGLVEKNASIQPFPSMFGMADLIRCPRCGMHGDPAFSCASCLFELANIHHAPPNLVGERFGCYILGQLLGHGGMGMVYEALDTRLRRTVALKMLAGEGDASNLLLREAELAASLEHEHIVPIYEADVHQGITYFTMKRMEGGPLETPVPNGRDAAEIALAVAKAIDFAHRHGVLHLDLKPANVLVDKTGKPFVTDFGLATRYYFEDDQPLVRGGTPLYMPPEVWEGKPGAWSTAADVWGVGALLYEMLAGRPPFVGSSADELRERVMTTAPPALKGVAKSLAAVCFQCLEKNPERRYATARDLVADLERFLNDEPVKARPRIRALYRTVRHPVVFLLVILTILLGVMMHLRIIRAEQSVIDVANATADSLAQSIASQLREYASDMEMDSRDPRVIAAFSHRNGENAADVCEYLRNKRQWPFGAWFLLDTKGKLLGRAPSISGDTDSEITFQNRDYFIGAESLALRGAGTVYISRVYQSKLDHDYKFALSIVVYDHAQQKLGLLVATLPTGSTFGSLQLPDVERKFTSFAVIAERDPGDQNGDSSGEPELVFLTRRNLARGAEVRADVENVADHKTDRSGTHLVHVVGTHFQVLVRVSGEPVWGDLRNWIPSREPFLPKL